MMLDVGVRDGNIVGEELTTQRCQSKATRELLTDKANIERYDWSDGRKISTPALVVIRAETVARTS
jgi:hypothetical protein